MSKALRLSEKWFRRGLWLLAFVFAGFLIGLGSAVVGDLPRVEQRLEVEHFMDAPASRAWRESMQATESQIRDAQQALEQAQLQHQIAQADHRAARDTFSQWLATRQVTERAEQDPELIRRSAALERLRQAEREALAVVEAQQRILLDARQAQERAQAEWQRLHATAQDAWQAALRQQELRVFGYRLALTLPLLAVAAWLFVRHRHGTWWPFVWGFVFFGGFVFFVELVPFLPSYGGYVRHGVGVVLTVLVGRYLIVALNRYLERQKAAEARPEAERRQALDYDLAQARLAKGVCPGCERPVNLSDAQADFCIHCGLCLFDRCHACQTRKNSFSRFCQRCGAPAASASAPFSAAAAEAPSAAPHTQPG